MVQSQYRFGNTISEKSEETPISQIINLCCPKIENIDAEEPLVSKT